MAYGDTTLDDIMAQMRGGEPRAQGRITQTSSFGLPAPAPVAPAIAPPKLSFGERLGLGAARFLRGWGGKLVGGLAAGNLAAEGLLGERTVANDIRAGVGLGTLVNPTVGLPLATGMGIGGLVTEAVGNRMINSAEARNDIRGPETKAFVARGGMLPATVAAPGDEGRDDTLIDSRAGVVPTTEGLNPAEMIRRNYAPVRGTGAISLNGGPAQLIDSRASMAAEAAAAPAYAAPDPLGIGAALRLKQVVGDNTLKVAQAKADATALAARGTAARGVAALLTAQNSEAAAAEHLRLNPGDYRGARAVAAGRAEGGTPFRESTTSMPGKDGRINIIDARTGAVQAVIPKAPPPSEADIQATAKANKMTREQVIARLKQEGRM